MRAVTTLLITTALVSATSAFAQTSNQHQNGGATAVTSVQSNWAHDASATAIASGNVVTTAHENTDDELRSTQHMDGDANASTDATVWSASGNVAAAAVSLNNGATATVQNGASDIDAEQIAHGDANAAVNFRGGYAANTALSASASNNTAAASATNADLRLRTNQDTTGSVNASIDADLGVIEDQTVSGVIASANNLAVAGETATVLTDVRQTATGATVAARSDLFAGYATDISGNATANGNSATIDNRWGYVNAAIEQNATADVSADSYVTLGGDFLGLASAGVYGVGNQASVSNVGSDTVMDVTQANGGDVSANAGLAGDGGQTALASSAAYGNAITGTSCASCTLDTPSLTASSSQSNNGAVHSSSVIRTTGAASIGATSTAIGNAATYQSRPAGG